MWLDIRRIAIDDDKRASFDPSDKPGIHSETSMVRHSTNSGVAETDSPSGVGKREGRMWSRKRDFRKEDVDVFGSVGVFEKEGNGFEKMLLGFDSQKGRNGNKDLGQIECVSGFGKNATSKSCVEFLGIRTRKLRLKLKRRRMRYDGKRSVRYLLH
jgi:hypothetical protein